MASKTKQERQRQAAKKKGGPSLFTIALGAMVVIGLGAILFTGMGQREASSPQTETSAVEISGEPLPQFQEAANDPAIGQPIPTVTGKTFDGSEISIEPDGTPKAIAFLAHWCPHCQSEVAEVTEWLNDDGQIPAGVEVMSVSTLVEPQGANYPPSRWLEREGWDFPTIVDSEQGEIANAYGLRGTPFWVFTDGDGNVVARTSGSLGIERIQTILNDLANQA